MPTDRDVLDAERAFHDAEYARAEYDAVLPPTLAEFRRVFRDRTRPYWLSGAHRWSDAKALTLRLAAVDVVLTRIPGVRRLGTEAVIVLHV